MCVTQLRFACEDEVRDGKRALPQSHSRTPSSEQAKNKSKQSRAEPNDTDAHCIAAIWFNRSSMSNSSSLRGWLGDAGSHHHVLVLISTTNHLFDLSASPAVYTSHSLCSGLHTCTGTAVSQRICNRQPIATLLLISPPTPTVVQ